MEGLQILKINLSKRFLIRLNTNYNTIQSFKILKSKEWVNYLIKWNYIIK